MQAVIMAGGKGARLRPYTNILPKPLLPLGLRPIIEINIRQLIAHGVDDIIVAVGYLGELIENVIGNGEKYGIIIRYSYEEKPLGTVGGLSLLQKHLEENFIVMNGDILHNVDFRALFIHHYDNSNGVTITTYKQLHKVKLGVLEIVDGRVDNYIEKPTHEYNVSMGIYVINRSIINNYVSNNVQMDFPDLINLLIKEGKSVNSFNHNDLWIDLGTTEGYFNIIDQLKELQDKYPVIPFAL